MKHRDHRRLAEYLMSLRPEQWSHDGRRRAFLCGSLLPDYNPFTYLRGVRQSRRMAGHDHPYSWRQLLRAAEQLQKQGVHSLRDCYVLGTVIHYLADSFTYPHTARFSDSMRAHRQYEHELCKIFPQCIAAADTTEAARIVRLSSFLQTARRAYEASEPGLWRDGEQILYVCRCVYLSILQEKA